MAGHIYRAWQVVILVWSDLFLLFYFLSSLHLLFFPLFPLPLFPIYVSVPIFLWPVWITGEGCGADWAQNRHGSPHLLHVLAGEGVSADTVILAMVGVLVVGVLQWEDVISLIGGYLNFGKSSFLTFCFFSLFGASIWVFSLWLGPGALDLGEAAFGSCLLFLSSSANCLHSLLWTLLLFSLSLLSLFY